MTTIKRTWVYQPHIRTFFWDRTTEEGWSGRQLEHDDEFAEWCHQNDCEIYGTWVRVPDERRTTLFLLRWA